VRPDLEARKSPLPSWAYGSAMKQLRDTWGDSGGLAHSHVSYLSSCLLHGALRQPIRELLARRFPVILVDEFQDTGHFAGRALLALLGHPKVRAMVVGDPDQAIYGFGGASGLIFDRASQLSAAHELTLA